MPTTVFASQAVDQPPSFGECDLFRIQSEMVLQCERQRDRFALLDPPWAAAHGALPGIRAVVDWRARFDSKFAALYFPWLRVLDPVGSGLLRSVPPCGHVGGLVASTDIDV